jgi:hypothetical protein
MGVSSIIKQFLTEVGGISIESRRWARIIEKYVSDVLEKEREEYKKTRSQNGYVSEPDYSEYRESYYDAYPTHFVNTEGEEYSEGYVYGLELNNYVDEDIIDIIENVLFKVEFDSDGMLLDVVNFEIEELGETVFDQIYYAVEDYIFDGGLFIDDEYDQLKVVYNQNDVSDYFYESNLELFSTPTIDQIEIEGKDFPEAYENFKVDKWIINNSSRIEYDHWKSGYNKEGEYVVYLNMPIYSVSGSALIHEIKHAFDDWNRMSRGAKPIRDSWEIKNIYTPDFEKLVLGGSNSFGNELSNIIKSYYMGSKLETPAYLENEYDYPTHKNYRKVAKKMMNFKASDYLGNANFTKYLQRNWSGLIDKYNIPFFRKFKNVEDFLKYTEKHFNKRGRDILRRIDKMFYLHGKLDKK